MKCKQHLN